MLALPPVFRNFSGDFNLPKWGWSAALPFALSDLMSMVAGALCGSCWAPVKLANGRLFRINGD
jgi:hypothetical protein